MISVFVNFEALEPINLNQINELSDALIGGRVGLVYFLALWNCRVAKSIRRSGLAGTG